MLKVITIVFALHFAGNVISLCQVMPISQSQADQRAGRAGRESEGKCFRVYTESSYYDLEVASTPEIQRTNISQIILQLQVLEVGSVMNFPFLSPPSTVSLRKGFEQLLILGALTKVR